MLDTQTGVRLVAVGRIWQEIIAINSIELAEQLRQLEALNIDVEAELQELRDGMADEDWHRKGNW